MARETTDGKNIDGSEPTTEGVPENNRKDVTETENFEKTPDDSPSAAQEPASSDPTADADKEAEVTETAASESTPWDRKPESEPDPAAVGETLETEPAAAGTSETAPEDATGTPESEALEAEPAGTETSETSLEDATEPAAEAAESSAEPEQTDTSAEPVVEESSAPVDQTPAETVAEPAAPAAQTPPPPPPPPPPPAPAPAPKGRFFPLLLGGLLAGGIGYGTHFYLNQDMQGSASELAMLQMEVAQLRSALAAVPPAPDLAGFEAELSSLRAEFESLDVNAQVMAGLDMLRQEISSIGDIGDTTQLMALLNQVAQELTQTRGRLDALDDVQSDRDARLEALEADQAATLQEFQTQIAAVRDLAEERIAQAEASVDATLARAGVEMMRAALETGAPFREAVSLLQDAGVTVPEVLALTAAQGVQTLEMLQESFPDVARAALRAALQDVEDATAMGRIEGFLRAQLGIRSTAPRAGDDPDAVLSRASAIIAQGDIPGALAELDALPNAAQASLAAWREAAETRRAAQAAFAEFSMTVSNQ